MPATWQDRNLKFMFSIATQHGSFLQELFTAGGGREALPDGQPLPRLRVLQRALQIHVVVGAVLASTLLGMGQRSIEVPLLVLGMGLAAFVLTDLLRWIRLNSFITNLLAGGVFLGLLIWNIVQLRGTAQIIGIANILVYMQIVCLFQEKDDKTCWALGLLGLLQVVVAAVLSQSVAFGVLLMAYLALAPATLGLLCAFREVSAALPTAEGQTSRFSGGGSVFRSVLRTNEATERHVVRLVRRHVRRVLFTTLVVTVALFFLMPRPRHHAFSGFARMAVRTVGFSDRVRLGELGKVIENPQEVLRLRLEDAATGERYPVHGPLYLRGAILTEYSHGQWSHPGNLSTAAMWPLPAAQSLQRTGLVRQDIVIEPLDRPELFCIWPILAESTNPGILLDMRKMTLVRSTDLVPTRFRYQFLTPAFFEGQQWLASPTFTPAELDPTLRQLPAREGPYSLPSVYALAERWMNEFQLDGRDSYLVARIFERQLRDSGRFSYTLQGQVRDPRLDPIEDFLSRNPRGHCEYFATALVLLLRSVGLPARLVVGFKTEEWNPIGGFFQVRQLHAHTWVEVYLPMDQLPGELRLTGPIWERAPAVWVRLDPTPPPETSLPSRLYWTMWKLFDWVDFLWRHYVVELDRSRQQEAIYRPISALAGKLWLQLESSYEAVGEQVKKIGVAFARVLKILERQRFLLAACLLALVALVVIFRKRGNPLLRLLTILWRTGARQTSQEQIIGFYRRLERLLHHWGLRRPPGQTPRELATRAKNLLPQLREMGEIAKIPERIVEQFYALRFGRVHLTDETIRQIHAQLDLLQKLGPRNLSSSNSASLRQLFIGRLKKLPLLLRQEMSQSEKDNPRADFPSHR